LICNPAPRSFSHFPYLQRGSSGEVDRARSGRRGAGNGHRRAFKGTNRWNGISSFESLEERAAMSQTEGQTVVSVGIGSKVIFVADPIKNSTSEAINALHEQGDLSVNQAGAEIIKAGAKQLEARVGIEPTNAAFAEPCLTTWLPRR
jgi:hypothetical protein